MRRVFLGRMKSAEAMNVASAALPPFELASSQHQTSTPHAQAEAAGLRLLIEGPPAFGDGDGTPVLRGAAWATLLDALAVAEFTRSFFTQLESAPLSAAEVLTCVVTSSGLPTQTSDSMVSLLLEAKYDIQRLGF